jgi:hypothetical protein
MKRIMMAGIFGWLACLATTMAPIASANYVYNVSLSVPVTGNDGMSPGNLTAIGTITVDMLGTLATSDVVDFSITITGVLSTTSTLTPSNADVEFLRTGVTLSADASSLSLTFPTVVPDYDPIGFFIQSTTTGDNPPAVSLGFSNDGAGNEFIGMMNLGERGTKTIGGNGGTYILGTAAPSSVAEPSSFLLAGMGIAIGLACFRRTCRGAGSSFAHLQPETGQPNGLG